MTDADKLEIARRTAADLESLERRRCLHPQEIATLCQAYRAIERLEAQLAAEALG